MIKKLFLLNRVITKIQHLGLNNNIWFVFVICFAALFFLTATCSKDDNNIPYSIKESASEYIEADIGGTIATSSGISLTIPPSALQCDTNVTVQKLSVSFEPEKTITIVRLYPEGIMLLDEATLKIPLTDDLADEEELEVHEFIGNNPEYSVHIDNFAPIYQGFGTYYSEISIVHFSGYIFAKNCHSGTFTGVYNDYISRGCDQDEFFTAVNERYPDVNLSSKCLGFTKRPQIRALLNTFFNETGSWYAGSDISGVKLSEIKQYVLDGRKVVISFGKNSGYEFKHTAILETDNTGEIQIRNTCVVGKQVRDELGGGEVVSYYPFDKLNEFRQLKSGVALELALCGSPGCLSDASKNKFGKVLIKQPLENRPSGTWGAVKIYIEKTSSYSVNPCDYLAEASLWCVWYADNISLNPVMVGTKDEFDEPELCRDYDGGGMDPDLLMEKVMLTEGHNSREEAIAAACLLFTDIHELPASSTFVYTDWIGYIGDTRYDLDELDGCQN
jgi:hypothetical protein